MAQYTRWLIFSGLIFAFCHGDPAVIEWDTGVTGLWSSANFWEYDQLPCTDDVVRLPANETNSYHLKVNSTVSASKITISKGATLVITPTGKVTITSKPGQPCARILELTAIALSPALASVTWTATRPNATYDVLVNGASVIPGQPTAKTHMFVPLNRSNMENVIEIFMLDESNNVEHNMSTVVKIASTHWTGKGQFDATCRWEDAIVGCNTHVVAAPDDDTATGRMTIRENQTVRSLTLKRGMSLRIESGGLLRISQKNGSCNAVDCADTTTTTTTAPPTTPTGASSTATSGSSSAQTTSSITALSTTTRGAALSTTTREANDGTTTQQANGGGSNDESTTNGPTTTANRNAGGGGGLTDEEQEGSSSEGGDGSILPIIVGVIAVLLVIVVLVLVIKRRKDKPNPNNTILTTYENQTFVGANGRAGFEAFEVNVQDTLRRGETPKAWDETQYATTADGGVKAALHRNDTKWDKDLYDTSQASQSNYEAVPSARAAEWDQATYDINDKPPQYTEKPVYAEASEGAVTVADSADSYQYPAQVRRLTEDKLATDDNEYMVPTTKGSTA
eukprot:TRINITY_DN11684_c0_g2_i1.p1 TRINITY_DN11684_c0_g2~~TRINITY_DN11684_c0_g2_i1.p1  ORF type:complete len:566 (+),score=130.23 TRINITY_DN11684_c0_g2_i1:2-1699(+)